MAWLTRNLTALCALAARRKPRILSGILKVVLLCILAALLFLGLTNRWGLREAGIYLIFAAGATQFGTTGAKLVLERLNYTETQQIDASLQHAITQRYDQVENKPAYGALESSLNQVVATWGLCFLIYGQTVVLAAPFIASRDPKYGTKMILGFIGLVVATIMLLILVLSKPEPLHAYMRQEEANPKHNNGMLARLVRKVPPGDSWVTWARVVIFALYAVLVGARYL